MVIGKASSLHLEVSNDTQFFALLSGVSFGAFTGPGHTGLTFLEKLKWSHRHSGFRICWR